MAYKLSSKSLMTLKGVHPDLVKVVKRAIQIVGVDFTVIEGLRSKKRQAMLVKNGASRTMNSRHITGHAVDLVPYYNGKPQPAHWPPFYKIADAMIQASRELNVKIRWGGNWGVHDISSWKGSGRSLNAAYKGKFHDGAHFELSRRFYS